jgi:DNA-binding YbaB/EbfC family protein
MFGSLGNFAALMKQAREMGSKMESLQSELRDRRVTGSAGAGLVEVDMNGLSETLACRIDAKLLEQGDRELLEDLICGAVNQAAVKAKQLHAESLKSLTGGVSLPGLDEALAKFTGQGPE